MRNTAEREPGKRKGAFPPEHSLILIAIIPTPRDLEIARVLGWYRIPYRFAPKIVQVDYIAFYQASVFGENHANRIESFAPVKGFELTTRREIIRDEPGHPRSDEEYYKIQLGDLVTLEVPILADKWRRITFLYTTGTRFSRAKIINDLVVHSDERKILWKSLRERAERFIDQTESSWDELDFDENFLIMLGELNRIREQPNWYLDQ